MVPPMRAPQATPDQDATGVVLHVDPDGPDFLQFFEPSVWLQPTSFIVYDAKGQSWSEHAIDGGGHE